MVVYLVAGLLIGLAGGAGWGILWGRGKDASWATALEAVNRSWQTQETRAVQAGGGKVPLRLVTRD